MYTLAETNHVLHDQITEYLKDINNLVDEATKRINSLPNPFTDSGSRHESNWFWCSYKALGCKNLIIGSDWINHHLHNCPYRPLICEFSGIHTDIDMNLPDCEILPMDSYITHLKQMHRVIGFEATEKTEKNPSFTLLFDKLNHLTTFKPIPKFYVGYNSKYFVVFVWENGTTFTWFVKILGTEKEAEAYSCTIKIQDYGSHQRVWEAKFAIKVLSIRDQIQPWKKSGSGGYFACMMVNKYRSSCSMNFMGKKKFCVITVNLKYDPVGAEAEVPVAVAEGNAPSLEDNGNPTVLENVVDDHDGDSESE